MTRGDSKLRGKLPRTLDKHDILYSRARYVLNQRHIKRPWFNLNPFLERTDEQIDLEDFVPDESKYIQKLQSLVLCENYSCDYPLDTRELTIGTFFPYIYSDIWDDGISVRILEGQLFDQLVLSLHKMEKAGSIVRHKTYAFARNKRPRTGCYKLADKETFGHIDETLLIEFTYFGDLDKTEPNVSTTNPMEYLQKYRSIGSIKDTSSISLPPIIQGPARQRTRAASISVADSGPLLKQKPSQGKGDKDFLPPIASDRRRGSLFSKPINTIRAINAMQPQSTGRRSSMQSSGTMPNFKAFGTVPQSGSDRRRQSDQTGSELPPKLPQRRRASIAAGNNIYSGFEIPTHLQKLLDEAAEYESLKELEEVTRKTATTTDKEVHNSLLKIRIEKDQYYGEELYLSDPDRLNIKKPLKAEKILQKKKIELQQKRLRQKEYADAQAQKRKEIKERLKLKPVPVDDETVVHYALNMPEKVPSFEQFIKLMKDEEYVDPRFRNKEKQKSKRIAKRYNLEKEMLRSKITISTVDVTPSTSQKIETTSSKHDGSGYRRGSMAVGSRGTVRLPPLQEIGVDASDKTRFADQVLGVTDSEPCREHCLSILSSCEKERELREKRESDREKLKLKRKEMRQPDIVLSSPSGVEQVVYKSPTPQTDSSAQMTPHMFPKVSKSEDAIESPVEYSDEDDDDDNETSGFDSTKLKLNYSIERLRKKKRKAKKRPAFFDILRKYYRAQAALSAFRKNSIGVEHRAARDRARKFSIGRYLKKAPKEEQKPPTPPMVVGKLKKFKFLDVNSRQKKVNLDQIPVVDFSTPKTEAFDEQLEKALKDFVVRREIVASDLNARCATSLTFTRKQSFKAKMK